MTIQLADRVQQIKPSPTFALAVRANQLKAAGKDIINLTIGEPDFDTPEHIKEAARRALHDGFTKYTATDGIVSLRQAVAQKFLQENKLIYQPNQIIVSTGAKQCLYNIMQALLNAGDEVIIPAPYWVSYSDMVLLAQAKPILVDAGINQYFKITAQQLEQVITSRTRLFMLNSPSNPTGMVYTQRELKELAAVLLRHPQIVIISDDIYEHIYWGAEPFANILNVCPDLYERTVVVNGVSKSYAMTGWRIGYVAGPKELIGAMSNVQGQSTSNPNSIAQVAAQAALEGDQQCVRDMCKIYYERHQLMYEGLNKITGFKYLAADGAFYAFPSVQTLLETHKQFNNSDVALAEYLLTEAGVAVIPGSAFGTSGCLRFSYAASTEDLQQALQKLQACF
jgi:aspartate aminotransferase